MRLYPIAPVSKPRMTQRDKWKKRPAVLEYFAFKDLVRVLGISLPIPYKVTFYIEMPRSWSAKKRTEMNGQPHLVKPDKDNLEKALLDALYGDDSKVWSGWVEKRWGTKGCIRVESITTALQGVTIS